MGAAASTALQQKDEMLSVFEVKSLYREHFDEFIFDTLKDEDGNVKREDVQKVIDSNFKIIANTLTISSQEVFMHYAGESGDMKEKQFCEMCRDARVLSKAKFRSADAGILYNKILKQQRVPTKFLKYDLFRQDIIPAIAQKFKVEDENVILSKFASVKLPGDRVSDRIEKEIKVDDKVATKKENDAAVKLQTISRQMSAVREIDDLKEIINDVPNIQDDFFSIPKACQRENKVLDVFCTKCPHGTITARLFVDLLKEAGLLEGFSRTLFDCKMAFTKALLLAKERLCYQTGVIASKFMTYRVFREVLIPCLAERFDCSIDSILDALCRMESTNMETLTSATGAAFMEMFCKAATKRNLSFTCNDSETEGECV